MTKMTLEVQERVGKVGPVRQAGRIPAVVYGPKQPALSVSVDKMTFEKLLQIAGESTIITLTGLADEIEVLMNEVAFNPVHRGIDHIDFYAIERGKELTTHVTIHFTGESPIEKTGGTIVKALQEITVTCRPNALPSEIVVDLATLTDEAPHLTVSDLVIPAGVTVDTDSDTIVATVASTRDDDSDESQEAEELDKETAVPGTTPEQTTTKN